MLEGAQLKEHVLNRVGYGVSTWASARYDELGANGFIAEQLAQTRPAVSDLGAFIVDKIRRPVLAERQLDVTLLDFWYNHFNVQAGSDDPTARERSVRGRTVADFQNVAILPNVLGDFTTLLTATAQSPAMASYLNNNVNFADIVYNGRQYGGNENYARELMELHTLGVNGGYNEFDVIEVARVLTAWGIANDAFRFYDHLHDTGEKTVMGVHYPSGRGEDEGHELLAFLAEHPSTANFVTGKLVRRFVGEELPAAVHTAAASAFRIDRSLNRVMQAIFDHPDFVADTAFRSKTKPPHRFMASALMAMGATDHSQWAAIEGFLRNRIIVAGELPYLVGPPTGYPDNSAFWVSSTGMIERFSAAKGIAYHAPLRDQLVARTGLSGTDPIDTVDTIAHVMVPGGLSPASRTAILDHVVVNAMSNDARISAAAHLIMCSPEFVRY